MRRDYHFPEDSTTFTILSDRDIAGPRGIFGGLDGRKAYYVLYSDTLKEKSMELPSKCVVNLNPGDTISFQTPGGGGYGDPKKRNPKFVLNDVKSGKISIERAKEIYSVIIDKKRNFVDDKSTKNIRTKITKNN